MISLYSKPRRRRSASRKWVHPLVKLQKKRIAAMKRARKKAMRAAGLLPPIRRRARRSHSPSRASQFHFDFSGLSQPQPRLAPRRSGSRALVGRSYPFASLRSIEKLAPMAKTWGVAASSFGPAGFLAAFKRAGGKPSKLPATWKARRNAFIRRHLAEARAGGEKLTLAKGKMTRRALALAMWGHKLKSH